MYRDSSGSIFYLSLVKEVVAACSGVGGGGHEKREKEKSLLVLSAYGVDEVGDDVAVHLTRVIEQKLAEYSYRFLSSLLERNSEFHLTPLDMEVVTSCGNSGRGLESSCGEVGDDNPAGGGRETAYLFLPKSIQDVSLFFLYLRQSICAGELVNPLFTTKPETEMVEEDNNAAAAVVSDHHHDDKMNGETESFPPCSKRSILQSRLPSTDEESETVHDIDNNNTSLRPPPPPPPDGGLLTPGGFTFYINLSLSDLSGLGPVTQRSAQSIGKGIAIIHLSPMNAEGKVEWDLPSDAALSISSLPLAHVKVQCEDEIRSLKEEVLDPLNSGLIFHPDLVCPLQVAATTSSGGTELDLEYEPSSSSCTPSCNATPAACDTEGQQQQGGLASRQQLRKSRPTSKSGPSSRYGIHIEVDACGAIDLPNLLNLMERYIDQALVDYWIERILLISKINSLCSEEEASIASGIRPLSTTTATLEDDGLDNNSNTIEHLPEPPQGCNNGVIRSPSPCLGSSRDGGQHQVASGGFCHTHHLTNAQRGLSSQQHSFPFVNARLCSSLGELLHAGEHLGNPTVRRVSLCEALPDWVLSRVLRDCIVALASCLQVPLDTTLLSFDMNGSCEVVSSLDKQSMRMLSSPEQPKSFVVFLGLQFPNCEHLSLIDQSESAEQLLLHDPKAAHHMKFPVFQSPIFSSNSSSSSGIDPPELSPALFPWAMEVEQVKETESLSLSPIDEGNSTSEKIRIGLDELFKQEHVVLQRRVLLVLHLSCRAQTLEAYNLHHLQAGRVYEALFSVLSAAKLQKLALEHVVCQNAGRLPPFSSLYPRKCSRVEVEVGAEQHHNIKLPRLPPTKQTKKQQGLRQYTEAIRLYPEPLKRIVSHASTDSMAFSPKLWEVIFAERSGMTRVVGGGTTTVPGSARRTSYPEGGLKRDSSSHKSIVAAAATIARHRGRHSSARIAALSDGGGGVLSLGQVNIPPPSCTPPRLPCHPSSDSSTVNGEGCTRFMLSPSLGGRSAWRRYVEHLVAPMPSSVPYPLPDITMKMTTTTNPLFHHHCCLPVIPIAKHMETLERAVAEEEFEANSLSKMVSFTWEGLQTLRWKPPTHSNKDQHPANDNSEEVWKIPNTIVAESLAKHARLLGVMVFPLPMVDADVAAPHQDPLLSSSFTQSSSSGSLGCCRGQCCDCPCTEMLSGSHGVPLHGSNNDHGVGKNDSSPRGGGHEGGHVDDHHVTRERVSKAGNATTGLFTGGLFDLLRKKWGTRYPFHKLVLLPQVSG